MSFWANEQDGSVLSTQEMIEAFPDTTFPVPFQAAPGYQPLDETTPEFDPLTQRVEVAERATKGANGTWARAHTVVALTPAEATAARKALVPASVTRRQARQALLLAGLLDAVAPAIAAVPDPVQRGLAAIEWEDSQMFERNRPLLIQLGAALGLGDAALDNLFIQAAKL